jgi:hypothetical protein
VKNWTEQPDGSWARDVDGRTLRIEAPTKWGRHQAIIVSRCGGRIAIGAAYVRPEACAAIVADVLGLEE